MCFGVDVHTCSYTHERDGGGGRDSVCTEIQRLWLKALCFHVLFYELCPQHTGPSPEVFEIQTFGFSGESDCICSISGLSSPIIVNTIRQSLALFFSIRTTELPSVNVATAITSLSSPRGTWLTR